MNWADVDIKRRLVLSHDRKDPRHEIGDPQKIPLPNLTGYDGWEILLQQRIITRGQGLIFPLNHRSIALHSHAHVMPQQQRWHVNCFIPGTIEELAFWLTIRL